MYAAFLRGINVGGKTVKMAMLKAALEELGFTEVKTLLASGNVVFNAPKSSTAALTKKIEVQLENTFGFKIEVILRGITEFEEMVAVNPFKKIKVTPHTRLYVTLYAQPVKSGLKIPYISPGKEFRILSVTEKEVFSVLQLSDKVRTVDAMAIIEKEFGKKGATTRNWNTIQKIVALKK